MIGDGELAEMLEQARQLREGFASTAPRPWDAATAGAELAVQLGHLALCVARCHGIDVADYCDPARPISDIGDELADVTLAALSISILDGAPPTASQDGGSPGSEIEALLLLLICAGRAAEAGLVSAGYRHQPTGTPPPVPEACAATLRAADHFARLFDLDLPEEFRAMYDDASRFLCSHQGAQT
ncbi:hypothetical protein [Sphaerimonospora thailandensis]|uniref:Uncharacterized protein n=1 Tax=Sphaerimonospora thailandensis TaxID=795644 RepID=A0A8J3R8F6_9ACTN|nr:hypothetical protein [Sphaerimonospora thailandensis]GIH71017.1 hypothetical protein Mth01_32700 [Sphaerimonospora thailandensis]